MQNLFLEACKAIDNETTEFNNSGVLVIRNVFDTNKIEELKNELRAILKNEDYQKNYNKISQFSMER